MRIARSKKLRVGFYENSAFDFQRIHRRFQWAWVKEKFNEKRNQDQDHKITNCGEFRKCGILPNIYIVYCSR